MRERVHLLHTMSAGTCMGPAWKGTFQLWALHSMLLLTSSILWGCFPLDECSENDWSQLHDVTR